MSCVTCLMPHVTCHMLGVTCHMSLTPTAKAKDPRPANFTSIHSRMLFFLSRPRSTNLNNYLPSWCPSIVPIIGAPHCYPSVVPFMVSINLAFHWPPSPLNYCLYCIPKWYPYIVPPKYSSNVYQQCPVMGSPNVMVPLKGHATLFQF